MVVFEKLLQDLDMTRYLFSITFDASPLIYMIGDEFIAAAKKVEVCCKNLGPFVAFDVLI